MFIFACVVIHLYHMIHNFLPQWKLGAHVSLTSVKLHGVCFHCSKGFPVVLRVDRPGGLDILLSVLPSLFIGQQSSPIPFLIRGFLTFPFPYHTSMPKSRYLSVPGTGCSFQKRGPRYSFFADFQDSNLHCLNWCFPTWMLVRITCRAFKTYQCPSLSLESLIWLVYGGLSIGSLKKFPSEIVIS